MSETSSAFFSTQRMSNSDSDNYDDITAFNASFPSVDSLQIMMDAEEAEFAVKINGLQIGGTMSNESWNGDVEFVLHIDGNAFEANS
jgi:hypothetical protein